MPKDSNNQSLLQIITHILDTFAREGLGYDTLITLLSLLCLLHIVQRLQPPTAPIPQNIQPATQGNPLQKILGELTKNTDGSGGSPSPDMLMSLLPLLNNPQIKSALNPGNISTILGLINSLGGSTNKEKSDKKEPVETMPQTSTHTDTAQDKGELGRSLNWKNNFQNDKEV